MSDIKKLNDEDLAKFNQSKELKEDELDKVVGGDGPIVGQNCPECGQETLYDYGIGGIRCYNCGFGRHAS